MRFSPGRLVMHRNVRRGRVGWVRPGRVIADDERGLLLWIAPGSAVASEVADDGRGMRAMPFTEWVARPSYRLAVHRWEGPGVLKLLPPGELGGPEGGPAPADALGAPADALGAQVDNGPAGVDDFAAHSVWWFRDAAGEFTGWYVNLESPGVRWDDGHLAGVDIVDQDLDIWVPPDRRWQWKDEEEFAERLDLPEHYWVPDAAAVRAEGERVVKLIEAGEFPFDGTWCDFRPDPAWPVPDVLPAGWDRPPARP